MQSMTRIKRVEHESIGDEPFAIKGENASIRCWNIEIGRNTTDSRTIQGQGPDKCSSEGTQSFINRLATTTCRRIHLHIQQASVS